MIRTDKKFIGYLITNTITKKQYIGITSKSAQHRLKIHFIDATNKKIRYKNHLHNSIRKYGKEFFKIETIKKTNTWKEICEWEISAIEKFKTKAPNGYNLTNGGEGTFGFKKSKESKEKLSKIKIEFYKIKENKIKQSIICKETSNKPEYKEKQRKNSKKLWEDIKYREKTTKRIQESWKGGTFNEKHKLALRKSTVDNPEWMIKTSARNSERANDPIWREKVKNGIKKYFSNPENLKNNSIKKSKSTKKYWEEGHEDRRKKHAKTMSNTIKKNLNNPEYQKWRKNNPPGAKPILYNFKYFRSLQEAADFFNIDRTTIDRHLLQKKDGCERLDKNKKYEFEIQYD